MCGIAGFFTTGNRRSRHEAIHIASGMMDALRHRGPDAGGVWVSEKAPLVLAHRRLSIIDLSASGNQPMHSESGRYVVVFNGEIYNFLELRQELLAHGRVFRGHSDTEVLLAGCEEWGVEPTISRCVGMFAMALWDAAENSLFLIRDRMGEKPLYYGWQQKTLIFASELKAMKRHPDFIGEIDKNSLALYFRYGYVPSPYSIYKDIYKLEPGTFLKISLATCEGGGVCTRQTMTRYWSLKMTAEEAETRMFSGSPKAAVDQLESLLIDSLRGQMIADVPLGAFLSGGTDSSTIVSLMQKLSSKPVRTFCIGFSEPGYNEATYARRIAEHLGCEHTDLYVTPKQVEEVIPYLATLYDEPFADSSQIPTFLVSQLARKDVTVSLSGDAGDELFYGYRAYALLFRRWRIARRVHIRSRFARAAILKLAELTLNASGKKLAVLESLLSSETCANLHRTMVSVCHDPCQLVLNSYEPSCVLADDARHPQVSCEENCIMALDALSYLPDDILVKVDRAAMACSLETRIPLLDHRIVEFAFRLPIGIKCRGGVAKWPLRQILDKYVPRSLTERPKRGFSLPLNPWLRGSLRKWMCDLLDDRTIREDGFLNAGVVRRLLHGFLDERKDLSGAMWSLVVFQCWLHQNHWASN